MRSSTVAAGIGRIRCGVSASGAPSTQTPASMARPDQRSDEANGTSSRTAHRLPGAGRAAASAALVRLGTVTAAANAPRAALASGPGVSPTGSTSVRWSRPVVSVPVLSVHTTSTLLTDSTALTCCTSAPAAAIRAAPAV